jgi:hypothetical protein
MSSFLALLFVGVVGIALLGIAIACWQKGGYDNIRTALWWGIGAYIFVGIGLVFAYKDYVIKPIREATHKEEAGRSGPYAISVVGGMGTDKRAPNSGALWFGYQSKFGQTLSPIHRMVFIRLTNLQSVRSMIETYRVEIQTTRGEWVRLTRIDGQTGSIYMIFGDPQKAILFDMAVLDSVLSNRVINPRETVEGAAFFELPENIELNRPLRIYVKDFGGAEMTQTIQEQPVGDFSQGLGMRKLAMVDLSNSKVGYYSEAMLP